MAKWNQSKALKSARTDALSGISPVVPQDFTDIGAAPLIEVSGVTTDFVFSIPGVFPQRADLFDPTPVEEPIERWPARPRGATFEYNFLDLDLVLDSEFIEVRGLTTSASGSYVGYYPGLSSSTQVGKASLFAVGEPSSFIIAGGVSLANTSYREQIKIYGIDTSAAGTQWSGTITSVNTAINRVSITVNTVSREIEISDPTQSWNITNVPLGGGGSPA